MSDNRRMIAKGWKELRNGLILVISFEGRAKQQIIQVYYTCLVCMQFPVQCVCVRERERERERGRTSERERKEERVREREREEERERVGSVCV